MITITITPPDPKVFRDAADVIRRNGWHQGDFFDPFAAPDRRTPGQCPVCVLGAVNVALSGEPIDPDGRGMGARRWLASVLRREPACWNDEPDRTVDEVFALLTRAAAAAEAARAENGGGGRG